VICTIFWCGEVRRGRVYDMLGDSFYWYQLSSRCGVKVRVSVVAPALIQQL